MSAIWATIRKLSTPLIVVGVLIGSWLLMGQAGYRAGNEVGAGPVQLDPEAFRGILSVILASIAGGLKAIPWMDAARALLQGLGLASPLTAEQILDQHERILDQHERIKRLAPNVPQPPQS